ncbi:MAG: DUF2157 domain-containing protein [Novosphingobium sp.]
MSERKLRVWQQAGLIDAETAQAIRVWEAENGRPLVLWAVIGIAVLSIALGLISVVAANWEDIPVLVRLGVHFAILAGAALALWRLGHDRERPWREEALLFVFGALGLTFFGHLGQAYQTTSPLWQPLGAWLVLFGPLFLLRGKGAPTALALIGVLVFAVWDYAVWSRSGPMEVLRFAVPTALPLAFAPIGAVLRYREGRTWFWQRLEDLGFAYGLGGASLLAIIAGFERFSRGGDSAQMLQVILIWALAGLVAAALTWRARPDPSGQAAATVLAGAAGILLLTWPLSGNQVIAALLFMALWALVGWMALKGQWRGVFQLAVAVLSLRLIVLSVELEDDLLTSGFGLIAAGLLILGIAWGARWVARTYAPPKAEDAP